MSQVIQPPLKDRVEDLITTLYIQVRIVTEFGFKWTTRRSIKIREVKALYKLVREASSYMEHSTPLLPHEVAARLGYALGNAEATMRLRKIKEPK
jgi:hypothetical protein